MGGICVAKTVKPLLSFVASATRFDSLNFGNELAIYGPRKATYRVNVAGLRIFARRCSCLSAGSANLLPYEKLKESRKLWCRARRRMAGVGKQHETRHCTMPSTPKWHQSGTGTLVAENRRGL